MRGTRVAANPHPGAAEGDVSTSSLKSSRAVWRAGGPGLNPGWHAAGLMEGDDRNPGWL